MLTFVSLTCSYFPYIFVHFVLILLISHSSQSSFIFFIFCHLSLLWYWILSIPFLIRSCSHWILHTGWWCCVDRRCYCFWYLHKMYFQIKYCYGKWNSAIIKNISLSILMFSLCFFCTSKITEFKIIHKKKY